jgi:hypothetical protein
MQTKHMRDHILHLRRMLGRTQHLQCTAFARNRVGDLPFQIELFLAADLQPAAELARRAPERGAEVSAPQMHRRQHEGLRLFRFARGKDGRQFAIVHSGVTRRSPGMVVAIGNHHENRLPDILHQPVGKHRIVVDDRAAIVDPRYIGGIPAHAATARHDLWRNVISAQCRAWTQASCVQHGSADLHPIGVP